MSTTHALSPAASLWRLDTRATRRIALLLVAGATLLATAAASLAIGAVTLSLADVWHALFTDREGLARQIVWNLRLPRTLLGALVGANLACSGSLLQAVMRNPLASPNIVGVTAGAGLAATIALVVMPGFPAWLPIMAFVGGLIAAAVVYAVSWMPGSGTSPIRMILAGVAVTSILGAITTLLMVAYSDRVSSVVLWMSGSLNGRSWSHVKLILPYALVGLSSAMLIARSLNVLQLGDEAATGLGMRVEMVRIAAVALAALLAGAAVGVAGMVGFIGLVVPHVVRLLIGPDHAWSMPAGALGGAALLVAADLLARTLIAPVELPVGVITAIVGGPYFIFLLYRTRAL